MKNWMCGYSIVERMIHVTIVAILVLVAMAAVQRVTCKNKRFVPGTVCTGREYRVCKSTMVYDGCDDDTEAPK